MKFHPSFGQFSFIYKGEWIEKKKSNQVKDPSSVSISFRKCIHLFFSSSSHHHFCYYVVVGGTYRFIKYSLFFIRAKWFPEAKDEEKKEHLHPFMEWQIPLKKFINRNTTLALSLSNIEYPHNACFMCFSLLSEIYLARKYFPIFSIKFHRAMCFAVVSVPRGQPQQHIGQCHRWGIFQSCKAYLLNLSIGITEFETSKSGSGCEQT